MHVALDTEHNLLQAGINFNFLLMTGKPITKPHFSNKQLSMHTIRWNLIVLMSSIIFPIMSSCMQPKSS
jgi:hypothetical protein